GVRGGGPVGWGGGWVPTKTGGAGGGALGGERGGERAAWGAPAATPAERGPPEGFYFWFGLCVVAGVLMIVRYYWRMDADRFVVLKLLTSSVMPLSILTVVVLGVILFGITTATE